MIVTLVILVRREMSALPLIPLVLQVVLATSRLVSFSQVDHFLDTCLDGQNHKSKPGPEDALMYHCLPWKHRSCCTSQVSQDLHTNTNWLNFDWNHCGWLSPKCQQHFLQDLCFYECSPNTGPWLVEDRKKIRNEKFVDIPLCRSECDSWWSDCKDDLTCLEDWSVGFNWTSGINTCPKSKDCHPFRDIYADATHFCEKVWGHSWKVADEDQPCMYLWFDPDIQNPNDAIARRRAEQLVGAAPRHQQHVLVAVALIAFQWLCYFLGDNAVLLDFL